MATNSFEPDTILVKAHSRKPAKRRSSFQEDEQPMGGGSSNLPFVGGAIGGMRAGVPGAALGGGIGEAARQLADIGAGPSLAAAGPVGGALGGILGGLAEPQHAPTSVGQQVGRMAGSAGEQAGYQILGNVTGAALKAGGKGAMNLAMRFTPEAAQTAIREGVMATRGGLQKVTNLLGEVGKKTTLAVRRQALRGARLDNRTTAQFVEQQAENLLKRQGIHGEDLMELADLHSKFLRDNGAQMTLERALQVKKSAGNMATPLHEAIARGEQVTPISPVRQVWEKELEKFLDDRIGKVVPGYHELNARASDLIRLKDELAPIRKGGGVIQEMARKAASPIGRTVTGATLGAGAGAAAPGDRRHNAELGAILGALAGNPAAMSALALALYHPATQTVARQIPRAVMQAAHE